jgi:hypothetical protein
MLGDGRCCLPGAITPLDAAASVLVGDQKAAVPAVQRVSGSTSGRLTAAA